MSAIELGKHRLQEEPLGIAEVVQDCLRLIAAAARNSGIDLRSRVDARLRLSADRQLLRQMLINLLNNAVKHTPKGGRIEVGAEPRDSGGLTIHVADTGAGIEPAMLSRITEPFGVVGDVYARKQGGVGLGLAVTKAFVERHGGRLEIDSALGRGTRMRLLFPPDRVAESA